MTSLYVLYLVSGHFPSKISAIYTAYTSIFQSYQCVWPLARTEWTLPSIRFIYLFMHLCIRLNHQALVYIPTEIPASLFIHPNIHVFIHSDCDQEIWSPSLTGGLDVLFCSLGHIFSRTVYLRCVTWLFLAGPFFSPPFLFLGPCSLQLFCPWATSSASEA